MLVSSLVVLFAITAFPRTNAVCDVCQQNGVACINSTSFYLCYGNNSPKYEKLYHCKNGFDCTDLNAICVQSNALSMASCGDTSLCGHCRAHRHYLFACTSRSTFRMCYGSAQPKSELGYCPDGFVCDASSDNVCVPQAQANQVTCDVQTPIDQKPENTPPIGPSTDKPLAAEEVCRLKQKIGVYQITGDTSCLEYIRCFSRNGVINGALTQCPVGTYFSAESLQCVLKKPSYCV